MTAVEIMMEEHRTIEPMLEVVRKACFQILEGKDINYDDFYLIIDFIRNYADEYHHRKEENLLFNKMVEHLGLLGEKTIKHGMLVEHDLGRLYINNLEEALNNLKSGNEEAKLDIIANAISYTDLLKRHINKEDNVVYKFALRELKKDIIDIANAEVMDYEEKNKATREKYMEILEQLKNKYIN